MQLSVFVTPKEARGLAEAEELVVYEAILDGVLFCQYMEVPEGMQKLMLGSTRDLFGADVPERVEDEARRHA